MPEYRFLERGEIIEDTDEVNGAPHSWREAPVWVPTSCGGLEAPDPRYLAHRKYRRRQRLFLGWPCHERKPDSGIATQSQQE